MYCPTPGIKVPDDVEADARKRRDVGDKVVLALNRMKRAFRVKRGGEASSDQDKLGGGDVRFDYGFTMDGMDYYKNMSQRMPHLGEFHVYKNPSCNPFPEENHLKVYQPYWPFQHKLVRIEVCISSENRSSFSLISSEQYLVNNSKTISSEQQ